MNKKLEKKIAHIMFDGTLTIGKRIICDKYAVLKATKLLAEDGFDGILEIHRDGFKCKELRIKPLKVPTNG